VEGSGRPERGAFRRGVVIEFDLVWFDLLRERERERERERDGVNCEVKAESVEGRKRERECD
jgi:hypothetical protein